MSSQDKEGLMEYSGSSRRRQMNSVLIVAVVCIICITILSGLQCYLNSAREVKTERKRLRFDDVEFNEEIKDDGERKWSRYDFKSLSDDHNMAVLLDASRGIEITKISSNDSTTECFVAVINIDSKISGLKHGKPLSELSKKSKVADSEGELIQVSAHPIQDKSILGEQGLELCADHPTYWSFPSACEANANHKDNAGRSRQKRQYMNPGSGSGMYCYLDPSTCGYFYYPDSPRQYYKCDRKCVPYTGSNKPY